MLLTVNTVEDIYKVASVRENYIAFCELAPSLKYIFTTLLFNKFSCAAVIGTYAKLISFYIS